MINKLVIKLATYTQKTMPQLILWIAAGFMQMNGAW